MNSYFRVFSRIANESKALSDNCKIKEAVRKVKLLVAFVLKTILIIHF